MLARFFGVVFEDMINTYVNSFGQKVAAENPPLTKLSEEPKNVKNSPKLGSAEDTSFQATSGKQFCTTIVLPVPWVF